MSLKINMLSTVHLFMFIVAYTFRTAALPVAQKSSLGTFVIQYRHSESTVTYSEIKNDLKISAHPKKYC